MSYPYGKKSGLYLHYPFCETRCPYCGFHTFTRHDWMAIYNECLLAEIEKTAPFFKQHFSIADTVYFGGGTPSLMPLHILEEIIFRLQQIDYFSLPMKKMEITMEINPDDLDSRFLNTIKSIGVNRLSIGAQRLNDDLLHILGRSHSAKDVIQCYKDAQEAGFKNISMDFIIGIPAESQDSLLKELEVLISLKPQHISVYMLEIKEHTEFAKKESSFLPDDNLTADLYLETAGVLTAAGYNHYEISNFALPGCESLHNLKYWSNGQWLGLGLSASSSSGMARWTNPVNFDDYIDWVASENFVIPPKDSLTDRRKIAEDEFIMGMRKTTGVDLPDFIARNGYNPLENMDEDVNHYVEAGLIVKDNPPGNLRFTINGFLVSNEILCRFIS